MNCLKLVGGVFRYIEGRGNETTSAVCLTPTRFKFH